MALSIIQAGEDLQLLATDGTLTTLTLPSGVTLRTDVPPRWAMYANYVILVNTPSVPLTIDSNGTVRPFSPQAPQTGPVVSAGSASGSLSGTYAGLRYTFIIKDEAGTLIAESDFSPASNSVTISSENLKVTGVSTSTEPITARRIYRPTTDGTVLFPWIDIEGNTITEVEDDLADAGLSLIAAPTLGNPPRLVLLKEWRNLLWGVGDTNLDEVVFSLPDAYWTFPAANAIPVSGTGRDRLGIISLMPRREALGIGRRDQIWQMVGESSDDFRLIKLSENTGVESNESVATYRDTVWWLWKDGVYQWDGDGIRNITDGKVSNWFSTADYFNRDMFPYAFAVFDPVGLKYKLFLAASGSTSIDRWIEYDLQTKTWWGPHKTDAFSPTGAFVLSDDSDKIEAVIGSSSGYVWNETTTATDHTSTGIDFDVDTRFFDALAPDMEKYWGELSIVGKEQTAGTLTITPTVGYLTSTAGAAISHTMSLGRQRLRRLGRGKVMQLNFNHTAADQPVELYGIEVPWHIIGRR